MNQILRVPPHCLDEYYSYISAYYEKVDLSMNEFKYNTKSVYVIFDGIYYLGIGYIYYGCKNNKRFYNLSILPFSDLEYYDIYMLIKTIIKDCTDQPIFLSSPEILLLSDKIINALKNNSFKYINGQYMRPNGYEISKLNDMNPRDDLHVIDKMICCNCKTDSIAEAQDKYIKDLMKQNDSNCCCKIDRQTVEEFLGETSNCCNHCCDNK